MGNETKEPKRRVSRAIVTRLMGYPGIFGLALLILWVVSVRMPGRSFQGTPPPLTRPEIETADRLRRDVSFLADSIGEREAVSAYAGLERASEWVRGRIEGLGVAAEAQEFRVRGGRAVRNFTARVVPAPPSSSPTGSSAFVVVGAHYDAVAVTRGADDNASGVAAALELLHRLRERPASCEVRVAFFTNEEPPFFWSDSMGSLVYARAMAARGEVPAAVYSLESIGYYSDSAGSQSYPPIIGWFYPSRGDFLAFVGNIASRALVHRSVAAFRAVATLPSAGSAAPRQLPGVGWSDHWSFWQVGIPAVMITGTAPYRNPRYHELEDVPMYLDFSRLSRAVTGIEHVVREACPRAAGA